MSSLRDVADKNRRRLIEQAGERVDAGDRTGAGALAWMVIAEQGEERLAMEREAHEGRRELLEMERRRDEMLTAISTPVMVTHPTEFEKLILEELAEIGRTQNRIRSVLSEGDESGHVRDLLERIYAAVGGPNAVPKNSYGPHTTELIEAALEHVEQWRGVPGVSDGYRRLVEAADAYRKALNA